MPTCPKGHDSGTGDYCDQCGSPLGGAVATATAPERGAEQASEPAQTCPQCNAARTGRFCEADGYDFVAADLGGGQAVRPTPQRPVAPAESPETAPAEPVASAGTSTPAEAPTSEATATPTEGPAAEATPADDATAPPPAAVPIAPEPGVVPCQVSVGADQEYHKRVQAMGGPDADAMTFPRFYPERHFQLTGQALVGRRSRSRGIDPQIDLTGPPEDPGVSHTHALLVPSPDGTWSVVDLDSSNGTYVNESSEPLPANTATRLHDGDRIHVGAWTSLTFRTAAAPQAH